MQVCDRCKKNKKSTQIVINKKNYDICKDCLDKIIIFIENKKKDNPNFLEKIRDNLEGMNG